MTKRESKQNGRPAKLKMTEMTYMEDNLNDIIPKWKLTKIENE